MSKKIARFSVTREFLCDVLHLPAGTRIVDVLHERRVLDAPITFYVEHDDLRPVEEGCAIPEVRPAFVTTTFVCGQCGPEDRFSRVSFESWREQP